MADDKEIYRRAHYYLLAKGHYLHAYSWWDECKAIAAFYLDKGNPTNEEVVRDLLSEVYKTFEVLAVMGDFIIMNDDKEHPKQSYDESLIQFHLTLINYLNNVNFNTEIATFGYLEALAQTCMTVMMKLMLPPGIYLGEPDGRILPIIRDSSII